nr:histone deacetylase 14 [Tanacetum cinerariifolium]
MQIDQAHQFVSPPSGDAIMDFVNQLGYTEEEFVQAIQTFLTDKENLRSTSPFHLAEEDLRFGNLNFVPKGEVDEVFGMSIPNELLSNNIRNAPYYNAYLEMVAKHDRKVTAEKEGNKKTASAKQPKSKPFSEKSSKLASALMPKTTKERPSKASTTKPPKLKLAKEKSTKTTSPQKASKVATQPLPVVEGKGKAIVTKEQAAHSLLALHTPKRRSTMDQFIFQRRTPAIEASSTGPSSQAQNDTSANIVRDSPSPVDAKTDAASEKTNSGDQGQAGSDPGRTPESRPLPEQVVMDEDQARPDPGESCRALSGIDPEPTHDEFMAYLYPKVHESLKFLADEHVILEDPISSTGILSSIKNLEDAYAIGDQFINDKSTKDETEKPNVEAEVASMVTVPIYQASFSVPPLSTPIPPQALQSSAWKKSDTQDAPPSFSKQQSGPYAKQPVEDISIPDTTNISDSVDNDSAHLPKFKQRPEWLKLIPDEERPATPEPASVIPTSHILDFTFMHWYYQQMGKTELTKVDFEGQAYEVVKAFYPDIVHLLNGSGQDLSISKMKVARYLDFGHELLIPEQMWINEVCTYNISASYGISHWWFNRHKFYIDRHIADSIRKVVRTHMRILSVVSIKAYSRYGSDYLKEITLRRADYQEYMIAKKDFKNLHSSNFEDLNLFLL